MLILLFLLFFKIIFQGSGFYVDVISFIDKLNRFILVKRIEIFKTGANVHGIAQNANFGIILFSVIVV